MRIILQTPSETLFEGEVDELLLPTSGGNIGVRAGHTHLISPLVPGELQLINGASRQAYRISSGTVEVTSEMVTVLTSGAEVA